MMEEKIIAKIDEIKDDMLHSIIDLVQIESVEQEVRLGAPFGEGVQRALAKALEISEKLGFSTKNLDNYIGYAQYGEGNQYVCAIGHLDVVPAGEGWEKPPFSGVVEDGVIFGRGVLDNKGPIISCLYGLYVLKELGIVPVRPIRIIFGCDEESGFEDIKHYLKYEQPPTYGFTPDCKYPVVYGEQGRAVVQISTNLSELSTFFEFVNTYFISANNTGNRLEVDYYNPEYGVTEMSGYKLEVEENTVFFEVAISYPPGITVQQIVEKVRSKAGFMDVQLILNYNPVISDKEGVLVRTLQRCYEIITVQDGTPVTITGATYAKVLPGIVPFGPSFPGQKDIAHNPNELMAIDDIMTNAKIYALSLYYLSQLK